MYYYKIIEIENLEPLKIGARGSQSVYSEPTKDYIPGSTIRGAMIGELIRLKLFDKSKDDILLNIECYNAYPYFNKSFYLPKPLHLRTDKHKWREAKAKGESSFQLSDLLEEDNAGKNHLEYSFISAKKDKLLGKNVDKEYRLHHFTYKSNLEDKEQENLFRYQAIVTGNVFKAVIRYEESLAKDIDSVFEKDKILYLGGSKGSGYGKCEVKGMKSFKDFKSVRQELGIESNNENADKEIIITCLSDCLFRNEFGQPISHMSESVLSQLIGKKVRLDQMFIQTGQTEGYNNTWKARYPKETTVKAGSILKYIFEEVLEDDEIAEVTAKLEEKPFGSRIQDGYGWLGVNINYPKKILIGSDKVNVEEETYSSSVLYNFKGDDKVSQTFKILSLGMEEAKKRWLRAIYTCIIDRKKPEQKVQNQEDTSNKLIISESLKNYQKSTMKSVIEGFLERKSSKTKMSEALLTREYISNNQFFSLNGLNFKELYKFFHGKLEEESVKELNKFAQMKLDTIQGQLFYQKEKDTKKFILELLKEALYAEHMREREDEYGV